MLRECRISIGFSKGYALEQLGVAERTLSGYEADDDAPADIIDRMADLYQAPIIRYWYIAKHPVGGKILPKIAIEQFPVAVLRLRNAAEGIEDECDRLAVIADDKVISEEEVEPTLGIMDRLEHMMEHILETIVAIKMNISKNDTHRQAECR